MTQLRPELVRGLILEEPAIMGPPAPGAESSASGLMDAFTMMRQMVPMMQQSGMTVDALAQTMAAAPSLSGGTMGEALQPDALAAMATALLQLDATVLDPVLNGSITTVYQPTVTLAVPGVVLAGDSSQPDTIVRAGEIAALAEHSPHIDVRVIAGAGHLIHDSLDHRATMLAAIQEFLAANAS
jgi:pimeloyl-ACP methyl ester carboxylesterase